MGFFLFTFVVKFQLMPFFENISLEVSGNDFNLTTNVNKIKLKFQISNPKSKIPEADVLIIHLDFANSVTCP